MRVLAILGATGTGKSKLSIQLAKHLNAEIINADALQMYRGLSIATNKLSPEEMEGIPHHLIDFVDPSDEYTVLDFVKDSEKCINDICSRGKIPILVGGSHYYIQSALFQNNLMGEIPNQQQLFQPTPSPDLKEIREALSNPDITSQRLHDILKSIDPIMADRWHSNDIRKIKRSIEVFLDTGGQKRYSDILMDQQPPIPRYELLIFWLHADLDKLAPRLDNRIDSMITSGLFSELDCLSKQLTASKFDYSHGILQAIGFKEFHAYRIAKDGGSSLAELKEPLSKSVESMKSATRKYARRQINWIRGKLLPCCSNIAGVDRDTEKRSLLYLLDGTNLNQWDEKVYKPSIEISGKFFSRQSVMPDPISLSAAAKANLEGIQTNNQRQHLSHHSKRFCAVCQKSLQGESEWKRHLQSRNHRKAIKIQNSPQWQHYQRLPEGESRAATTP